MLLIMRYKQGSKVEVFCQSEKPAGSWRCAEILYGNGHNYTVKYKRGAFDESIEERVSRNLIRPCPPRQMGFAENWKPGDVVEILHNLSWKMATVAKMLARDWFLVRLVGSSNVFKVGKDDIRTRQSWLGGEWLVIGKGSADCDDKKSKQQLIMKHNKWFKAEKTKINFQVKDNETFDDDHTNFHSSRIPYSRKVKRESPYCYPPAEEHGQKLSLPGRECKRRQVSVHDLSQFPVKVKDTAFATDMIGKEETHTSANKRTIKFSDLDFKRRKRNGADGCSAAITSEDDDADKAACSASCSSVGSNDPFNWPFRALVHHGEDAEDHSSDAESVCCSYDEESNSFVPKKEELAVEIHRLELHAYRRTMKALHASGPLSWEQETLITNLRISLHISNDEHLMELRNLISNSGSIPIS